jgi:hypothetical protein
MPTIAPRAPLPRLDATSDESVTAVGIDTHTDDPVNGVRIAFEADLHHVSVHWRAGSAASDEGELRVPYELYIDGREVDPGKAHRIDENTVRSYRRLDIPRGHGDALIEIRRDGKVIKKLALDKIGLMQRVALGIEDFRNQANIFAGLEDGFLGALEHENAAGLYRRAGVHLVKGLTPDAMLMGFAGGVGIDTSVSKAIKLAAIGLGVDAVEVAAQGVAALTNGVGALWKTVT